jgi:hypothetical protein
MLKKLSLLIKYEPGFCVGRLLILYLLKKTNCNLCVQVPGEVFPPNK